MKYDEIVTGGVSPRELRLAPEDPLPQLEGRDEVHRKLEILLYLHPDVDLAFRNSSVQDLPLREKEMLLADVRELLGIKPLLRTEL